MTDLPSLAPITPEALETVDTIAARWLAEAAPVRLAVAASEADREATFRLRYHAIVERGWKQPEDMPDGIERDEWDDDALHVVAWEGANAVGSFRLIFPEAGRKLPVEEAFDLTIEPAGQVVELGRITVAHGASEAQRRVFKSLVAASWHQTRARGYVYLASDISAPVQRLYRTLGLRVLRLGPPLLYWGENRFPAICDVPGSAETLAQRWVNREGVPSSIIWRSQ
jgi:N-acyl-L-homoserine lactone synthetase